MTKDLFSGGKIFSTAANLTLLGLELPLTIGNEGVSAVELDNVRDSKPNITYILTNDVVYNDLSFTG